MTISAIIIHSKYSSASNGLTVPRMIPYNPLTMTKFGRRFEVELVCQNITKWRDISLVSRRTIRQTAKNSKNTTRRTTSATWRIFAELNIHLSSKLSDNKAIEDELTLTSMEVSMF